MFCLKMNPNLEVSIWTEHETKEKNKYFGRDEHFNSVIVESNENLVNEIKKIKIMKINQNTLFGEIDIRSTQNNFAA